MQAVCRVIGLFTGHILLESASQEATIGESGETAMGSIPHVVEDCLGIVQVYSDGSVSRLHDVTVPFKVQDDGSVVWKDFEFDKEHGIFLRLYRPRPVTAGLPIIYFFHGGGFCVGSRTWANCHNCCLRLSSSLQALVVAPDYRLAPEHRLPAAVDDALKSLEWIREQAILSVSGGADEWLAGGAVDFDRVFVVGDSSGGTLAHHMAVELQRGSLDMAPVRVRGYVLMAPFFGGTVRTKSEAEGQPEAFLNLEILDRFWRLAVPEGETSDHPLANPFGPESPDLEPIVLDPILVIVGGREVMRDRVEDYSKKMKELGKEIDYVEFEGNQHGFFVNDPFSLLGNKVLQVIQDFVAKTYNNSRSVFECSEN